ncbi:MAG: transcription elongation factor Spt5 [Methanosarcinales archaeon]|jgi:transcriptional antiterminator NusG|nr:transcription elongation factor Spt5 [Methanosarcinales archaeon]
MFEAEKNGDVNIFIVKTTVNQEKSVAKSMALVAKKEHLDVRAVLAPEELKGYVFVETPDSTAIDDLIKAIPHAKTMLKSPAKFGEIEHFLKPKPISVGVTEGSIIEITSGPFKGEKAKVKRVGSGQHDEITVELFDAVVPIPITIRGDTVRVLKKEEE